MSDPTSKRVDLVLQQLEQLPTLPAVAVRVLEATGDDDAHVAEVTKIIESDPALSARILQMVHRADIGVRGEVSSVERAVVLLGFNAVRSAVLALGVFETFVAPTSPSSTHFSRDEFWKHCLAVGCCAELLADELGGSRQGIDPSEAFVCGLLHDLGKIALDAALPKSFSRVVEAADLLRGNIADVERSVIGVDHLVVGKRLAERWQLPANLRDCIWLHGQLPEALPATVRNPRLVNLVTLADQLVREQHLGYSGNYSGSVPLASLLSATGVRQQHLDRARQRLVERIEPRARALGLGEATSAQLYQQALTQANRELGRVSEQLATRNRRLAVRARFFEALSSFHGELRPDAPTSTVLQAIAQTAIGVLDNAPVAAFSLPPGRDYAECVIVGKTGDVVQSGLADLAPAPDGSPTDTPFASLRIMPGDGPIRLAGAELEWLLNSVGPRLGHDHRWWIALHADGQLIGGVLWGGAGTEPQRLGNQLEELSALAGGWALALRTCQIREESRALSEQLAEANRQLQTAQSQVLRARTMATIGEIAAGAAHEMNNPLAVISGRSQLLARELSDPRHQSMAALVAEQAQRLSDMITDLMEFARPQPPQPDRVEVAELVEAAVAQAKRRLERTDTSVEMTLPEVPAVRVDRSQISNALAETLCNALQATDSRNGRVEVSAGFDPLSRRVVLSVTDNGAGMDENTLRHAFDPFFSARKAGRRRGMGLPRALRWVEQSGGELRLESRVDEGTRAIFLLPADESVEASQAMRKRA
jgi:putative nucleotidyltransferase with HDIG domain